MNEVNVESIDSGFELTELIEPAFLGTPIEPVAPVLDEGLQIPEIHAVVPAGTVELVRKSRPCESRFQILQDIVRNMDGKRNDSRIVGGSGRLPRRRQRCSSPTVCA